MAYFIKVTPDYFGFTGFKGRRENRPYLASQQFMNEWPDPQARVVYPTRAAAVAAVETWNAIRQPYYLNDGERDRPRLEPIHSSRLPDYLRKQL